MKSKLQWVVVAVVGITMAVIGCLSKSPVDSLSALIADRLGSEQLVIGSRLGDWSAHLGRPATVEQKDMGETFFYWPNHGVAVFCHPLYCGQYRSKPREEWIVTSILVPFERSIHPRIPPVESGTRITFQITLLQAVEIERRRLENSKYITIYYNGSVMESIQVRKPDGIFGDYD